MDLDFSQRQTVTGEKAKTQLGTWTVPTRHKKRLHHANYQVFQWPNIGSSFQEG